MALKRPGTLLAGHLDQNPRNYPRGAGAAPLRSFSVPVRSRSHPVDCRRQPIAQQLIRARWLAGRPHLTAYHAGPPRQTALLGGWSIRI